MAALTIKLEIDPETGKKNILIGYESDADALPIEHEAEHKKWLDKLIKNGLVKEDEIGQIKVLRENQTLEEIQDQKQETDQKNSIDQSQ